MLENRHIIRLLEQVQQADVSETSLLIQAAINDLNGKHDPQGTMLLTKWINEQNVAPTTYYVCRSCYLKLNKPMIEFSHLSIMCEACGNFENQLKAVRPREYLQIMEILKGLD